MLVAANMLCGISPSSCWKLISVSELHSHKRVLCAATLWLEAEVAIYVVWFLSAPIKSGTT